MLTILRWSIVLTIIAVVFFPIELVIGLVGSLATIGVVLAPMIGFGVVIGLLLGKRKKKETKED